MAKLPNISSHLDTLRLQARFLASKGFKESAIELMRISRGEIRIEAGCKLYGLNATDMKKARTCTNLQRMILAASKVLRERIPYSSEEEYEDAIDRINRGNLRWPKGNPKAVLIIEQAELHRVSPSSLGRFMKTKGWTPSDPLFDQQFEYPDWHPDLFASLFEKGEKNP
jgi:hypothetical protein